MDELETKIEDQNPKEPKIFVKATRRELEKFPYDSEEYKLFTFDFLGEPQLKDKDSIRIIKFIGEHDVELH